MKNSEAGLPAESTSGEGIALGARAWRGGVRSGPAAFGNREGGVGATKGRREVYRRRAE